MPGPRELTLRPEHSGTVPAVTVLAGPTAVGKGTVSQYIREHYPQVSLSVSATTRQPRPGEIDGVHYSFLTHAQFNELIKQGKMLEWAEVQGVITYGSRRETGEAAIRNGQHVLLEIDLQGARQVRQTMPEATFIFLAPPSWDELVRRLVGRGTESRQEQQRRLETARLELAAEPEFDAVIVNDTVGQASSRLVEVMQLSAQQ
ncbi:MAG: guanylate kinase [Yaniella sp.]|nr:guanylate kinase [Yaniella sp.]